MDSNDIIDDLQKARELLGDVKFPVGITFRPDAFQAMRRMYPSETLGPLRMEVADPLKPFSPAVMTPCYSVNGQEEECRIWYSHQELREFIASKQPK